MISNLKKDYIVVQKDKLLSLTDVFSIKFSVEKAKAKESFKIYIKKYYNDRKKYIFKLYDLDSNLVCTF